MNSAGPLPADYAEEPAPDPAMFGLPVQDDGSRNDPLVGQNIITCNDYRHDFDALRAACTRVVIGVGAQSWAANTGRPANRTRSRPRCARSWRADRPGQLEARACRTRHVPFGKIKIFTPNGAWFVLTPGACSTPPSPPSPRRSSPPGCTVGRS